MSATAKALLLQFGVLHEQYIGVVLGYDGRLQAVLAAVGLALQDVHGQLHEFCSVCGVNVGGRHEAVLYRCDAAVFSRQAVYAEVSNGSVRQLGLHCPACSHGQPVVLTEDNIHVGRLVQHLPHGLLTALFGPVALLRGNKCYARIAL